jgi:hypothetical protein
MTQHYYCVMLPLLGRDGNLRPGIHPAAWAEISQRFGGTPHRRRLLAGLAAAARDLRKAGCRILYLDGSYVTAKRIPGDYDACWNMDGVDPDALDPVLLQFDNRRAAMRRKYRGDLFPAQFIERGSGLTFLEFFQLDKDTGKPKGIVALDLGGKT